MKRTDWFDEILQAAPSTEEMTSLVTISLFEEEFGSVRLDWWIHVGGYLRLKWEERIILEPKLNLRIGMNPDPVLVAEFNEWLSKTSGEFSFSTTRESRETWERAVPAF